MLTTEPVAGPSARPWLSQLGTAVRQYVDAEAALAAIWPFMATRLAFLIIGFAAPQLFVAHATRQQPAAVGWVQWDAHWFIATAEHGYPWKLFPDKAYSTTAFFPLYPALIRLLMLAGAPAEAAALLIPNLAYLGALYYLFRLVRLDHSPTVATRTIWLLSIFPTAVVFFIPYTESLYVLLAVLTFWHLRRRQWLRAGIAGALGALTRQSGIVLALPYLVEWYTCWQQDEGYAGVALHAAAHRLVTSRRHWLTILPALLMPLAVAGHLAYLWRVTGSPVAFLQVQRAWHRRLSWPWDGVIATLQRWSLPDATGHQVHIVVELTTLVLFLLLFIAGWRALRPAYTAYAAAVWLAALISPAIADNYWLPIMSSSRFALSVFPSFIALALLLRRPSAYQAWLTVSIMALGLWTTYYVMGGWVA